MRARPKQLDMNALSAQLRAMAGVDVPSEAADSQEFWLPPTAPSRVIIPGFIQGAAGHCNPDSTALAPVSGTAYASALPVWDFPMPITGAHFKLSAAGTGAATGEIGIGTSTGDVFDAYATSASITPLALGDLSTLTLTTTGAKTINFNCVIPPRVQAWVVFRLVQTTPCTIFGRCSPHSGSEGARGISAGGAWVVGTSKAITQSIGITAFCPLFQLKTR